MKKVPHHDQGFQLIVLVLHNDPPIPKETIFSALDFATSSAKLFNASSFKHSLSGAKSVFDFINSLIKPLFFLYLG